MEAHDEVCRHLGELALKRIIELEHENSEVTTSGLEGSLRSVWPEDLPVEIEKVLRHELAAIERRSRFRVIQGYRD